MYAQAATPTRDAYVPKGPKPVFVQARDIPVSNNNNMPTGEEFYYALSKSVANDAIVGIQRIGSLWRIYVGTQEDRVRLITSGLQMRQTVLPVYDINPFTKTNNEELTRVTIKDIPLSVGDDLLKASLEKLKCKVKGQIIRQKLRVNGQLVNCLNGDRVCYIEPPSQPLPRMLNVANIFRGRAFHTGQPEQVKNCSKCLETGHHTSQCTNEVKCRICKNSGHKSTSCHTVAVNNENTPDEAQIDTADQPQQRGTKYQHTTDHASQSNSEEPGIPMTQRRDDVIVRTKTPRQPDISHYLRPKSTTTSPPRNSRREDTDHTSDDSSTLSSGESTQEERIVTPQKTTTPKKMQKRKSERKKGNTRK